MRYEAIYTEKEEVDHKWKYVDWLLMTQPHIYGQSSMEGRLDDY